MSSPLPRKLGMKPGMRGLIAGAPTGYLGSLKPLPEGIRLVSTSTGEFDFIQVFVTALSDVTEFAGRLPKIASPNALVWISYPKQTAKVQTDLNRDIIWKEMNRAGWPGVSIIAIDETWSALRVRPADRVHSRRRSQ